MHIYTGPVQDLISLPEINNFTLSWTPPFDFADDGILFGHDVSCHIESEELIPITRKTIPFPLTSTTFSSLAPHTSYACCVTPKWTDNGAGPQRCVRGLTGEDGSIPYMILISSSQCY